MSYSGNFTGALNELSPLPPMTPETAEAALPKHLARLPGGQWALWRWVALRGAGFPAAQILRLAEIDCGRAARDLDGAIHGRNREVGVARGER